MTFIDWLRDRFPFGGRGKSPEELESLRAQFQERFEWFKRLISANRNALERMTEIEESTRGVNPGGMTFARSRATSVAASVREMIDALDGIAPGKYDALYTRYDAIKKLVAPLVYDGPRPSESAFVVRLEEVDLDGLTQVGEKMATLGEIRDKLGLIIPEGFSVTARGYWYFMNESGLTEQVHRELRDVQIGEIETIYKASRVIQARIEEAELPADLAEAIEAEATRLSELCGEDVPLAVRSSAQGEDQPGKSFAGMYDTILGVRPSEVVKAYRRVVASKYGARAISYRLNYGIQDEQSALCVGCMPLVDAVCGGVAYSGNPLDSRDASIEIHSAFGLPAAVVEGSAASDLVRIDREGPGIVEREVQSKLRRLVYDGADGVHAIDLEPGEGEKASISDEQALELAREVAVIEAHFGAPQDVEWAIDGAGRIVFLQSRTLVQHVVAELPPEGEGPCDALVTGKVTASPGVAAGEAFVVRQERDLLRFPEGAVLVVAQPLPDWALAVRRSAAIVSEQGGHAGHLANVARELGVPALYGVEGATDLLEERGEITVDADGLTICEGRVEELLARVSDASRPSGKEGGLTELAEAAQHIVPLHLLDPEDIRRFAPERCTTFHDITRFCHEKAVQEMFRFGSEQRFPERAAKRLHVGVPTQFWVVDLADGLKQGAGKGKYVRLDDLASKPMLALWHGMMTIPWEAPPVDARGFLEVLMESTSNPALNPSMPSPYSERNYFMVTRKYVSGQVRFGYHYSTVDAIAGDRRHENYVSFHFRGGAANDSRRVRRARLVEEILREYGFRAFRVRDSVRARLEKYDLAFTEERIKVIGYLAFHTRQLDMVLKNENQMRRYGDKLRADLETLIG